MSQPPARPGGGMSGLYANLLGDTTASTSKSSSATISKAPVVFAKPSGGTSGPAATPTAEDPTSGSSNTSTQKKINAAALRFQPTITKRPAPPQQKKGMNFKPIGGAAIKGATTTTGEDSATTPQVKPEAPKPVVKTTLEDWVGDDEDVNGFYNSTNKERQRAGRKKRKKNKATPPPPTNWDDIYDPLRPNSYEEYKEGDEKIREMEDWRERLYGKKRRSRYSDSSDSEDERRPAVGGRFAPPTNYSFAPPPQFAPPPPPSNKPPTPAIEIPDDASGEDAFARRMRMSQRGQVGYAAAPTHVPQSPTHVPQSPPPPPPPAATAPASTADLTISRAPVLYTQSAATESPSSDLINPYAEPSPEPEASSRPGQAGFAKRLMERQGWKAGQGLGRDGKGITKAIQMVSSGKKGQPGRGKIVDKNKKRATADADRSEVVVMRGIVDGKRRLEDAELMQKIGDEYKRYGRVVQIKICWDEEDPETARVYVLFADVGSAQMAVNGLQRREIFEGNKTEAAFYPKEKFEALVFE